MNENTNDIINLWGNEPVSFFNEKYTNEQNYNTSTINKYLLGGADKFPAIIVFPGGGYSHRAIHEGRHIALWLNSIGINAFVLNYRVAPYTFPASLADAKKAISYVRVNADTLGVDPCKIGVLGFSAGGHLACLASNYKLDGADNKNSRPDVCVLCYPVISLETDAHKASVENLLGDSKDLASVLSGENIVTDNTPPTFIWHTANDAVVNVSHSLNYAKALSAAHIEFEMHIFPDGKHGLGLADSKPDVAAWRELCRTWLRRQGFIQEVGKCT